MWRVAPHVRAHDVQQLDGLTVEWWPALHPATRILHWMITTEQQLIKAYLAGRLTGAGVELAEFLILMDHDAAAMVDAAMDIRNGIDCALSRIPPPAGKAVA